MRELQQIVQRWQQGTASTLATLVRVQGSSYRRAGARLMVSEDGTYEGSISAGCLEAGFVRKAAWLTRNGPIVERYSTLFDETTEIPFGLGCGGVLDVLLEPVAMPECQALLRAMESSIQGFEHQVVTWLPGDGHAMMRAVFLKKACNNVEIVFSSDDLPDESLSEFRARCLHGDDPVVDGVFVERLVPPQRLFIFGAGDDARPLATIACLLGWKVTVADGRAHLARKARFPEGNVNVVSSPAAAIDQVGSHDAVVIMTHSYEQDRDFLAALLPAGPGYLGLLGSRQRSSLLIASAAEKLDWSVSECCASICAPIGLNIGGEGPEEIALAIIAEIQGCCMGMRSDSRRLSPENIGRYLEANDTSNYGRTGCGLGVA